MGGRPGPGDPYFDKREQGVGGGYLESFGGG